VDSDFLKDIGQRHTICDIFNRIKDDNEAFPDMVELPDSQDDDKVSQEPKEDMRGSEMVRDALDELFRLVPPVLTLPKEVLKYDSGLRGQLDVIFASAAHLHLQMKPYNIRKLSIKKLAAAGSNRTSSSSNRLPRFQNVDIDDDLSFIHTFFEDEEVEDGEAKEDAQELLKEQIDDDIERLWTVKSHFSTF